MMQATCPDSFEAAGQGAISFSSGKWMEDIQVMIAVFYFTNMHFTEEMCISRMFTVL